MVVAEEVRPRGVAEQVVHPAHVPFHGEAQAAPLHRARHAVPAGRLLGDHMHVGEGGGDGAVQVAQEGDGVGVLVTAIGVGHPFPWLAAKVEVEHGGHGVHPQAVEVVVLQPEKCVADEEVAHLITAIVEHQALPLRVVAAPGVGVFVQSRAVELAQAMRVTGEVGGHPVQQHPDAVLVQGVHQRHQVLRCAVARGGGIKAGDLVAPGAIKRVLGHRQQLDMGKAHGLAVLHQALGQRAVVQELAALATLPRAQVHFVDGHGLVGRLACTALGHPVGVLPVVGQVPKARGGERRVFGAQGEGVGLVEPDAVGGFDAVFVALTQAGTGHEASPAATAVALRLQCMRTTLPAIEVAHHRHAAGVRGPHRELRPRLAGLCAQPGALLLKLPVVRGDGACHRVSGCVTTS